jgi:hypothetical protein
VSVESLNLHLTNATLGQNHNFADHSVDVMKGAMVVVVPWLVEGYGDPRCSWRQLSISGSVSRLRLKKSGIQKDRGIVRLGRIALGPKVGITLRGWSRGTGNHSGQRTIRRRCAEPCGNRRDEIRRLSAESNGMRLRWIEIGPSDGLSLMDEDDPIQKPYNGSVLKPSTRGDNRANTSSHSV